MKSIDSNKDNVQKAGPYRVMVVDDSAVIRGFICRYLTEDADIEIACTAANGKMALAQMKDHDIEVVVLDIEMPVMDGMTALPLLLKEKPDLKVVMASTLTLKNAEVSLRAMQMGAVDYVPKPETARSVNSSIDFRRDLVDKVKAWAGRARTKKGIAQPEKIDTSRAATQSGFVKPAARATTSFVRPDSTAKATDRINKVREAIKSKEPAKITLQRPSMRKPSILAVGSSTGGPQALMKFFKGFSKAPAVPIVITQHMPATFTGILAQHLGQASGWPSKEAEDGDILQAGHIYVAPGDFHLTIHMEAGQLVAHLNQDPQENFCRPSVEPMLRSLHKIFKERVLTVILTGMGHDGLKAARDLVKTGATLLAQDEETSVVWGMPGAVATAGLCSFVMPIDKLSKQAEIQLQGGL